MNQGEQVRILRLPEQGVSSVRPAKPVPETLPSSPPFEEVPPPGQFEWRSILISSFMWKTYVSDYFPKFGMNSE